VYSVHFTFLKLILFSPHHDCIFAICRFAPSQFNHARRCSYFAQTMFLRSSIKLQQFQRNCTFQTQVKHSLASQKLILSHLPQYLLSLFTLPRRLTTRLQGATRTISHETIGPQIPCVRFGQSM